MRVALLIIISFFLVGCISVSPPIGKWVKKNEQGQTEFNISSKNMCWLLARGNSDGIGFECSISKSRDNNFKVYILERDGSYDSENYFYISILQNENIELKMKEGTIVLHKSN